MIYIYKIGHLPYTPFDVNFSKDDLYYLEANGIKITNNKNRASIFIAGNENSLKNFILKNPFVKNYLLWSQEPRFSKTDKNFYYPFLIFPKTHVMNVYTGDVFTHNVSFQKNKFFGSKELIPITKMPPISGKPIAALMSFYKGGKNMKLFINGKNIDLIKKRSDLANFLSSHNLIDIYGQGWPQGISLEDSRFTDRQTRKKEILEKYNFNICFENTVFGNYITEKIWESIESYCLPIYYGGLNSRIYDIFPKNSFIDYAEFEDPLKLMNFILQLDDNEFIVRMNKCIEVFNSFAIKPDNYWDEIRRERLNNIIKKCFLIAKNNSNVK